MKQEGWRTVPWRALPVLAALSGTVAPPGWVAADSGLAASLTESHAVAVGGGAAPELSDGRADVDGLAKKSPDELDRLRHPASELRRERDLAEARAEDLLRRLQTMQDELVSNRKALADAQARIASLEKDRDQLTALAGELRDQARDLTTKLAAEQVKSAALREDKQRLMAGTTTAKEEIARLQKRAGELETEAARAQDLAKRLAERGQEIAKLRKLATEREGLSVRMAALTDKLERTKQRVATLTGELALLGEEAARMRQERDRLSLEIHRQQESWRPESEPGGDGPADPGAPRAAERVPSEQSLAERSAAGEFAGEATDGLPGWLQSERASGTIAIHEGPEALTITLLDRVLFVPGDASLSGRGQATLHQISEVLKARPEKQIRVEGHTDNLPIGPRVKDRYPTNWELSTARATAVLRYLVEETGLQPSQFAAVGYADTRPVASNETEEGRMTNRRVEIVVSAKEFADAAAAR